MNLKSKMQITKWRTHYGGYKFLNPFNVIEILYPVDYEIADEKSEVKIVKNSMADINF